MSSTDQHPENGEGDHEGPPEFELEWRCDDPEDCAKVTVFDPAPAALTTHWITVDEETAVPIEEAR